MSKPRRVTARERQRRAQQQRQGASSQTTGGCSLARIAVYAAQHSPTNDTRRPLATRHTRRYVKAARRTYDGQD